MRASLAETSSPASRLAAAKVTAKDRRRFARARVRGEARAQDPSAIVEARYATMPHATRSIWDSAAGRDDDSSESRARPRRGSDIGPHADQRVPRRRRALLALPRCGRVRARTCGAGVRHAPVRAGDDREAADDARSQRPPRHGPTGERSTASQTTDCMNVIDVVRVAPSRDRRGAARRVARARRSRPHQDPTTRRPPAAG